MQAVFLSNLLGHIDDGDLERIKEIFERVNLPIYPPKPSEMDNKKFLDLMAGDKKAQAGTIRLVLLKSIGEAYVTGDYPQELLEKTLTKWRA